MSEKNRIFTDAQNAAIAAEYLAGTTIAALASRWFCSDFTIREALRRTNTPTRQCSWRRRFTPQIAAEIARAYTADASASLTKLAAVYECSPAAIRDYLKRAGVRRRPRGGANFKGRKQG